MDDDTHNLPLGLFLADQFDHVFPGQRLKIQTVGGIIIGGNGFRVTIDHDRFISCIRQGIAGMDTAIVKFDPLADAVWPAAQDDHFLAVGDVCLAFRLVQAIAFIAGIHIRGRAGKFACTGVDPLIDRADIQRMARLGHSRFFLTRQLRQTHVGKAQLFKA